MVTAPHYWGRSSPSFRSELALWLGTQSTSLFTIRRWYDVSLHSPSMKSTPGSGACHLAQWLQERAGRPARQKASARDFAWNKSKNSFRRTASRSQYTASQPTASCLSFGREQRTPPVSAEDGTDRKRRRKPSLNPWSTAFSRARIEEHYGLSHPKMWGKLRTRVVAADVRSAAAVQQFFNKNKLVAQLGRATAGNVKITISCAVGKLISSLYAHSISMVNRTDIHPSFYDCQNQRASCVGMSWENLWRVFKSMAIHSYFRLHSWKWVKKQCYKCTGGCKFFHAEGKKSEIIVRIADHSTPLNDTTTFNLKFSPRPTRSTIVFLAYCLGNVHGVNIIVSLSEDVEVPGLEGGSALSDNVVSKTVLSIIYALTQLYAPL
jgi:hypothetical protein